jgi:hypothetical protein
MDEAGASETMVGAEVFGVSLFECEQDLRVGGVYRFAFGRNPKNPEVFSVRYLEWIHRRDSSSPSSISGWRISAMRL